MEHICTCNNCYGIYIDTNPKNGAQLFEDTDNYIPLNDHYCPICNTDDYLMDIDNDAHLLERINLLSMQNIIQSLQDLTPDYEHPEELENLETKTQPELIELLIAAAKYWREQAEN